ncbi:D-alanyl-D-alanine carboxypeptidase/D-alanyl-D-alanine-endopeptidase [Leptolyngbya sp. BL0902]|uniref:D-alanyl-D-alanine carboxypeptidase/D-alanyl-D-alanine endopeptidase n=1 Tax=Leptolyngbya sp. BL0902 TaxID=1115757 RepID=UPI0018E72460|nr:D-alanyl-D-alanine carboxypeptidase/D-alanyl-D-alanine-endopeptidase [Leptolyngbya sp. BL0902]
MAPTTLRRRWRTSLAGTVMALGLVGVGDAVQAALCPAQVNQRIEADLAQAPLDTAYVGLLAQTQAANPQQRRTLLAQRPNALFVPASNMKVLTSAAALHRLGPSYRIRTSVHGTVNPGGMATLRVVGRGDPTVGADQMTALATQLRNAGVTQVNRLVMDDSYFPGWATNPTWEWEDAQFYFAVPVNGLMFNQNALPVRVAPTQVGEPLALTGLEALPAGPWPLVNHSRTVAPGTAAQPMSLQRHGDSLNLYLTGQMAADANPASPVLGVFNPAEQFAAALQTALSQQGIPTAQVDIAQTPAASLGPELAAIESPPMAELLVPTNRDSDNIYAEVLLKTLGVAGVTEPPADASRAGAGAIRTALTELGVNAEPLRIADGSGLSRHNLISPAAVVDTLQAMAIHPQSQVFRNSLAVAGESGTLRNRLVNTPLSGRVMGKTGALTGHVSLSAYVQPPNHPPLIVSIAINHSNQHASVLRAKIDEWLLLLAQLSPDC